MDPLTTAALAGAVAWVSILAVIHLPAGRPIPGIRRIGGLTIALLGAQIIGIPMPSWLPLAVLAGGGIVVLATTRGAAAA